MPSHPHTADTSKRENLASVVITSDGEVHGDDTPENREIARRIQACVNACEGISTEDLEAGVLRQMVSLLERVGPILEGQSTSQTPPLRAAG